MFEVPTEHLFDRVQLVVIFWNFVAKKSRQKSGILNRSSLKCDRLRLRTEKEISKIHQSRNLQDTEYRNSQFAE